MSFGQLIRPHDIAGGHILDPNLQQYLRQHYQHAQGFDPRLPIDPHAVMLPQGGHPVGNHPHGVGIVTGQHTHAQSGVLAPIQEEHLPWPPYARPLQHAHISAPHTAAPPHPADARHAPQPFISSSGSEPVARPMFSNPPTISDGYLYKTTGTPIKITDPRVSSQTTPVPSSQITEEQHDLVIRRFKGQTDALQERINLLTREKQGLVETVNLQKAQYEETAALHLRLTDSHKLASDELRRYQQDNANHTSKISQLQRRCGELAAEAQTCKENVEEHKKLLAELKQEIFSKNEEIKRLQVANDNLQREVANIRKGLGDFELLQRGNQHLQKELQRLGAQLSQQARQMHTIHEGGETKDREIQLLEKRVHDIQEQANAAIQSEHAKAESIIKKQVEEIGQNAATSIHEDQMKYERIIGENRAEIARLRQALSELQAHPRAPPYTPQGPAPAQFTEQQLAAAAGAAAGAIAQRGSPSPAAAQAAAQAAMAAAAAASGGGRAVRPPAVQSTGIENAVGLWLKPVGSTNQVFFDSERIRQLKQNFVKLRKEKIDELKRQSEFRKPSFGFLSRPDHIRIVPQGISNAVRKFTDDYGITPEQLGINPTASCFLIPPNFNDKSKQQQGLYVSHSSSAG